MASYSAAAEAKRRSGGIDPLELRAQQVEAKLLEFLRCGFDLRAEGFVLLLERGRGGRRSFGVQSRLFHTRGHPAIS